jgi:hypothetical protein
MKLVLSLNIHLEIPWMPSTGDWSFKNATTNTTKLLKLKTYETLVVAQHLMHKLTSHYLLNDLLDDTEKKVNVSKLFILEVNML